MKRLKFERGQGQRYEDEYGSWLSLLREIAESPTTVELEACPRTWVPFVVYIGGQPFKPENQFAEDYLVGNGIEDRVVGASRRGHLRTLVEMCASIRPELIDALWKSDCQWVTRNPYDVTASKEPDMFGHRPVHIVANYGAYTRPDMLEYDYALQGWVRDNAGHFGCVVSACAADKPYPAPHHVEIEKRLPDKSWHQVIASGVVGIVPEELWPVMPLYDAGMPNLWRCMTIAAWYFGKMDYTRIVVYADFYNRALQLALGQVSSRAEIAWVHSVGPRAEYLNLCDEEHLQRLEDALANVSFGGRPLMMRN